MFPVDNATNVIYTLLFVLALFGNLLFLLYLLIHKLRTSVDRLIFSLTLVEFCLVVLGIPYMYDFWMGEPYNYGPFGCRGLVPIHSMLDYTEAFAFTMMCVFIAEKLRGDQDVKWRVLVFVLCIYVSALVMVLPYFGVMKLGPKAGGSSEVLYCEEDWNPNAEKIHHVAKVILQFVLPFGLLVYYNRKAHRTIKYIIHYLTSNKGTAHYQSFSKVVAESQNQSSPNHLCFTESEDMNLQMNHLYQKHNSISSIRKDEETANISVQIFTNEVEIDRITCESPLWRGKIPDTKWKRENEFQKMVVSIKWFRYTQNISHVVLLTSIIFLISVFPFQLLILYTVFKSPYDFSVNEKLVCNVVFCLRFLPALVTPWCFMIGVFKYRKSLFGRCYRQPRDFHVLQDSQQNM